MISLQAEPHWTEADQAELDLLVHEFVRTALAHRDGCSECRDLGSSCARLRDAWQTIEEWKAGRILRSKAAWLRGRETMHEFEERLRAA